MGSSISLRCAAASALYLLCQRFQGQIIRYGRRSVTPIAIICFLFLTNIYTHTCLSGTAYFFTAPPTKPVTPLGLRAPELILTGAVDNTVDVWSFGCLVFELITGQPLFCIPGSEYENDDHLLSLTARLGALPDEFFRHWKTSSLYFTPERKLFNCQLGGIAPGEEPLMVEQTSMEELFDRTEPDLDEEEAHKVKALIRWVLQYDPAKRPSPARIMSDPWFCEIDVESD